MSNTAIYTHLAKLYDKLMEDVDYESWANYIDEIIQTHHSNPIDVMEVACGTGSLILSLAELECYRLTGTDQSFEMIEVAQQKATLNNLAINFNKASFTELEHINTFDCVYCIFDSINYLIEEKKIIQALNSIHNTLKHDGIFIFDFSTPKNSIESVHHLNEDEGEKGNFRFFRKSWYQIDEKIHYNSFEIQEKNSLTNKVVHTWKELHKQRAFTLPKMLSILEQTPYHIEAKYDSFDLIEADENSTRITIVLRCQKIQ